MISQVHLGDLAVDVIRKEIKHVHLSVHPPTGRVRIAAPSRLRLDTLRIFAISKLPWIRQQQRKLGEQERETPREYLDRESHYLWGRRYLLAVMDTEQPASVELGHSRITLRVRAGTSQAKRQAILETWYREQLKNVVPSLIVKWERLMGVEVKRFYVQRMKTRWGSSHPLARTVRLNTDLAKKPRECLEYIIVHEMAHFLEPTHNNRFVAFMNYYLPKWQSCRQTLNRLPVRHESWSY